MIVLDTDIVTLVQRVDSAEGLRIRARILQLPAEEIVATTIITYEEHMRGWLAKMSQARTVDTQIIVYDRQLQHVANYRLIKVLAFDQQAAQTLNHLRAAKIRVRTSDLKIAAICLAKNALLVSRNLRDFSGIPNLRVEDWAKI